MNDLMKLMLKAGIVVMGHPQVELQAEDVASNFLIAQDAQPGLVTVSNSGIPAFLTTYIDPKFIEVLVSPMNATLIVGEEVKKGDWTTLTTVFPVVEYTGETSSYGDYSENGNSGVNTNFPHRQSYHYETFTQWGERELEMAGLAKIDLANRLNIASALTLNKFQNKSYFYGVANMQNYGLLNDPALLPAVTPTLKAAGGTTWGVATALEVYADIVKLFGQLQAQANGLVTLQSKMTLAMSPTAEVALTGTTQFNVNVTDLLKKNFPNLTIKTAPEYATPSGQLMQLIVDEVGGQRTADTAFTEKMRAHPIVVGSSNWKQKKSQGTWGTIIYRPFLIAQMLGI
jgi:hypothetical protein